MQYSESEANMRIRAIFDTAIDGIVTINAVGTIDAINPAAAELFGYSPQEVIGHNVNVLMPQPYRSEHDEYIQRYQRTGRAHIIGIGREVEGRKKSGEVFPLRLAVSEVIVNDERFYTGIIHDLTQVKAGEQRIAQLNQELEGKVRSRTEELTVAINRLLSTNQQLSAEIKERQAVEAALQEREIELREALNKERELNLLKTRFVSMASHEFRTPLSTILSSVELLEMYAEQAQTDRQPKHISRIKAAVGNLNDVLNDFLSLSRLEEGKMEAKPEPVYLQDFCQQLMDELSTVLKPGQSINYRCEHLDQTVIIDPRFLRNIIINIFSNASKYSGELRTVHCLVARRGNLLEVTIQDEGIGIPQEDQPHLFTRFFRAHNVENIKGTGLGLHIVKRYVDLMGGTISYESEIGVGSTFTVLIPVTPASQQSVSAD